MNGLSVPMHLGQAAPNRGYTTLMASLRASPERFLQQETWLILPVVICLFQGLSHASLRVNGSQ